MALTQHQPIGFIPLSFSESPEIPDELNYEDLVDELSTCSGSVNDILDQIDLDSLRSGSVNEVLDLLEDDPTCENDIDAFNIDDVDIPNRMSLNNTFNQIMNAKYPKPPQESDSQLIPSRKLTDRNEPPKPTIRSVQGNQYRFGLIGHKINTNRGAALSFDMKNKQDNCESQTEKKSSSVSCLKSENLQGNINDQLKEYFKSTEIKNTSQTNLNSFGTSANLSPFLHGTNSNDTPQQDSVNLEGKIISSYPYWTLH